MSSLLLSGIVSFLLFAFFLNWRFQQCKKYIQHILFLILAKQIHNLISGDKKIDYFKKIKPLKVFKKMTFEFWKPLNAFIDEETLNELTDFNS